MLVSTSYSFNSPVQNPYDSFDTKNIYFGFHRLSEVYLEALLKSDEVFFTEAHKDPLRLLLPLLEIHATYLYEGLVYSDRCLREGITSRQEKPYFVENAWGALRMMKHDGMGPLRCI